jgi:hypothetical protein
MFSKWATVSLLALSSLTSQASAISRQHWSKRSEQLYLPKEVNDYKIATAPNNVTVRYKNPGICESVPGVDSYAGYVDISPNVRVSSPMRGSTVNLRALGSRLLLVLRVSKQPCQRSLDTLAQWWTRLRFANWPL